MTQSKEQMFDEAVRLADKFEENFLQLGDLLRRLKEQDRELFRKVCAQSGLGTRQAYYLVRISRRVSKLAIPATLVIKIGWTKMSVIEGILTEGNWSHVATLALIHTLHELKIIVAGGQPVPGTRPVLLYFTPAESARFSVVLMRHGGMMDSKKTYAREKALMAVFDRLEELDPPDAPDDCE